MSFGEVHGGARRGFSQRGCGGRGCDLSQVGFAIIHRQGICDLHWVAFAIIHNGTAVCGEERHGSLRSLVVTARHFAILGEENTDLSVHVLGIRTSRDLRFLGDQICSGVSIALQWHKTKQKPHLGFSTCETPIFHGFRHLFSIDFSHVGRLFSIDFSQWDA